MARKHLSRPTKHFVRWAQKDRCFLCSYPLVLYCHFHHIISVNDYGPEHYLNLIGLCANHHGMLENLKRTRSPSLSKLGTYNPKTLRWNYKIKAALAEFDELASDKRKAMDQLLAPYFRSGDSMCGIFEKDEPSIKIAIAKKIINRDIELVDMINSMRPRIFFPKPRITVTDNDPYDILLMNQVEFQKAIDQIVSSNLHDIANEKYDKMITLHLLNLGLPGSSYANDGVFKFRFSRELIFSLREIREMTTDQIYSL